MKARTIFSIGLNRLMIAKGLDSKQVAERSGVSIRQMKRLVEGECLPTSDSVLNALTSFFQVEESDFFLLGLSSGGKSEKGSKRSQKKHLARVLGI